jgi:hypothetical protein
VWSPRSAELRSAGGRQAVHEIVVVEGEAVSRTFVVASAALPAPAGQQVGFARTPFGSDVSGT